MPKIVGFGYRSGTGKDTAIAEIIKQRGLQYKVKRYAFADALKEEVNEAAKQAGGMFELICDLRTKEMIPLWVVYDKNPPMNDPLCPLGKQRTLLQWWGTEYRRHKDPDYWVKKLIEKIAKENPKYALLGDMRFLNETKICDIRVKVDRPGIPIMKHISEHALDDYDNWSITLMNDCPLERFLARAVNFFDVVVQSDKFNDALQDSASSG